MRRAVALGVSVMVVAASIAACSSSSGRRRGVDDGGDGGSDGAGGGGGGKGTGGATSSSSGSSSSSSSSGAGGGGDVTCLGGGGLVGACAPQGAVCTAVTSRCIALDDPCGKSSYTMRMSQLTITAPQVLAQGLVASIVANGVQMNLPECNLQGNGAFSWLLQFDEVAQTLTTGGARPEADPTSGYCMMDEVLLSGGSPMTIAPATTPAVISKDGTFSAAPISAITIPIFLDLAGSSYVLIPMKKVTIHDGKLSPQRRCIGEYNADQLQPANSCLEEPPAVRAFDNAAMLDAFITLEDADDVIVDALGQSLCVLLSGDAATYGNGASPNRCKRDGNGKIIFKGDWCAATNQAASGACYDASKFNASFAASAVKLKGGC